MQLQLFEGGGRKERETEADKCKKKKEGEEVSGGDVGVCVGEWGACFVHWGYFSKQCRLEAIGRLL